MYLRRRERSIRGIMAKLSIKTQEDGSVHVFIDGKRIERVCEYTISEKVKEAPKAVITFYPSELDVDLEKKVF